MDNTIINCIFGIIVNYLGADPRLSSLWYVNKYMYYIWSNWIAKWKKQTKEYGKMEIICHENYVKRYLQFHFKGLIVVDYFDDYAMTTSEFSSRSYKIPHNYVNNFYITINKNHDEIFTCLNYLIPRKFILSINNPNFAFRKNKVQKFGICIFENQKVYKDTF